MCRNNGTFSFFSSLCFDSFSSVLRYTYRGGGKHVESYMEVTWLTGFLILLNAGTLAFYLSAKPCRYRYVILYSAVIPLLACTLFHRLEWLFTVFIEALFFRLIYHDQWKSWLLMMAHRLLCNFSCYVWYGGSFHLGIYFIESTRLPLLCWCLLSISWLGMFYFWKQKLASQSFIYSLELKGSNKIIKVKGYLDSGNLITQEGIPVVFLDRRYEEYFKDAHIQWIVMNTMQGHSEVKCHMAQARIMNAHYHPVWIHFTNQLQLPLGAKALLNLNMMTQE